MITNLKIQNFTLIDRLDIDFRSGFSVITGETGAGKSIILGALSMLLGQRADTTKVKAGAQRCTVEAHFCIEGYGLDGFFTDNELDYDTEDTILRREISAQGKSRAFINDTPVALSVLRELGEQLVDIHSQHQNLLLRDSDFQLSVLDIIADDATQLAEYQTSYDMLHEAGKKLRDMQEQLQKDNSQEDYLRFQLQELREAQLSDSGEQEELEQQQSMMSHTEDIKSALYAADGYLNTDERGVLSQLRQTLQQIQSVSDVYEPCNDLQERLDSSLIELRDISSEITSLLDHVDFDPQELERINDRLDTFYSLEKKHHCDSLAELISLRESLEGQLALIDNSDEAIAQQQKLVDKYLEDTQKHATKLTKLRQKAAKDLDKAMKTHLVPLGMPNVQFETVITDSGLKNKGTDTVTFMFSANKGTPLQPVAQIASGGEIARVMLSLKALISSAVSLPTIIFDEIDTGVSGRVAESMATIMKEMGDQSRQVISITHLPQIAALGKTHYKVSKSDTTEETRTQMVELTEEERIQEIAQMLSGSTITDAALAQAKELLSFA